MSKNLEVRISSRTIAGLQTWEGTITIPGSRPTKLVQRSTGNTTYSSRSALLTSARSFAKNIGYTSVSEPMAKTTVKQAAKKSLKSKKTVANKKNGK